MKRIPTVIILLIISISSLAQHADSARFNHHLEEYKVQFGTLMVTRGMGVNNWEYYYGSVNSELLQMAVDRNAGINLSHYSSNQHYFEYKRDNSQMAVSYEYGLLFYIFSRDTLFSYLMRPASPLVTVSIPLKADSLLAYERQLKSSISNSYRKSSMAIRGVAADPEEENYQLKNSSSKICDVLLPKIIRDSLKGIHYLEILPALNIASIPFYILQPYNNKSFLVDSMCVVMGSDPSAYIRLSQMMTASIKSSGVNHKGNFTPTNPLVIGNPTFGECATGFSSLPGAEQEADSVARLLHTTSIKGRFAYKDTIRQLIKSSDFIYLATHAYASPDNTMDDSFILLADHNGDCGKWTPREIQFDSIKPESIVILSACESGMGRSLNAGVMSVARGFIKAGAQNVVYSYWPVADASTKTFMVGFIHQLKIPQRFFPAQNLRMAILEYKKNDPDISAWGAFTLMGVPYPMCMTIGLDSK